MPTVRRLFSNPWVRLLVTALLLGLVLWKVQPERLAGAASSINAAYLLIALVLTVPFLYLKTVRWYLILRAAGISVTLPEAALSLVGGMGLALLTPARLGELVRVAYLRDPHKLKIGALVMVDKGFDVLVLAALSIPGAWHLLGAAAGVALLVATVIGLFVVYEPRPLHRALLSTGRLPLGQKLLPAWESLESLSPASSTLFIAVTAASFAVVLLQFGIILLGWHSWSPQIVLFTFPLVILTNILPLTIGGLGIREGVAAVLLAHYGIPVADAALAAFLMFAINTALPGIIGSLLLPAVPIARPAPDGT
ncbi:MAG TPA: lysylphosphatidylglycerol synthase transmembrane domain-containing protein [Chloroflexota bacterium]|nr:lysylphosphatidylglycerol synthase transmembrane domain-containing protein [Chloroflexota bacterium]